nr:hypothetical protein [Geoanaerobacter pelophilus]
MATEESFSARVIRLCVAEDIASENDPADNPLLLDVFEVDWLSEDILLDSIMLMDMLSVNAVGVP